MWSVSLIALAIRQANMMTALAFIVIIVISGLVRKYFRHKFDVQEHLTKVDRAYIRHEKISKITSTTHS